MTNEQQPETRGELTSSGVAVPIVSPRGQITAALASAAANQQITRFKRAWLTAVASDEGGVTTEIHAEAEYLHRGEIRTCHHSFEIVNDGAMEAAFAELFETNANAIVGKVMHDAAVCHIMAEQGSELTEAERIALANGGQG